MQPTNYCRNVIPVLQADIEKCSQSLQYAHKIKFENKERLRQLRTYIQDMDQTIRWIRESQKFILPTNGYILSDKTLRALSPSEIHLPFPTIALEYPSDINQTIDPNKYEYSKTLIVLHEDEDDIHLRLVSWLVKPKTWTALPALKFPKRNAFKVQDNGVIEMHRLQIKPGPSNLQEYQYEITVVLDFLNALACKNVHMDQTVTSEKKPNKVKPRDKKSTTKVLPFDTYRYLTIDVPRKRTNSSEEEQELLYTPGDRYRPREHLRMGHPRKYKNGITLWINDMKINEGIGHRVEKTYIIRGPKQNKESVV